MVLWAMLYVGENRDATASWMTTYWTAETKIQAPNLGNRAAIRSRIRQMPTRAA
jgi:hypothetical protein